MKSKIAVLILAAGASTRMGSPKQLLPWGNTTLLGNAIRQFKNLHVHCFVVLGANNKEISNRLSGLDVSVIINKNWEDGIGRSISYGLKEILSKDSFSHILIALGDQPLIGSQQIQVLIDQSELYANKIIANQYSSGFGVPAIFPNQYFEELIKLTGDAGAKKLLMHFQNNVVGVDSDIELIDVDTPEEYNSLIKKYFS